MKAKQVKYWLLMGLEFIDKERPFQWALLHIQMEAVTRKMVTNGLKRCLEFVEEAISLRPPDSIQIHDGSKP